MEIRGPRTAAAGRLFEALQLTASRNGNAHCASCGFIKPALKMAFVAQYSPRDDMMKRLLPAENVAAYAVCQACDDDLPEDTVFRNAEKFMVDKGLLNAGHKPLDVPGKHTPKSTVKHNRRFRFEG